MGAVRQHYTLATTGKLGQETDVKEAPKKSTRAKGSNRSPHSKGKNRG
jgi:hypothetical protein